MLLFFLIVYSSQQSPIFLVILQQEQYGPEASLSLAGSKGPRWIILPVSIPTSQGPQTPAAND